ncbi:MAG: class I tRNA ligase family protein, partial [Planctomycetaceae bacterium]|nr:class I tRNA ligase family protein [Planctomycetaceae bacterium]
EETDGHFWTFTYPVIDDAGKETGDKISFSTTRPETMLGDTAVCVHPTDERYTNLVGRKVKIPLNGRAIPIIADALLADRTLGTGAVKVTPAHDPNDYACWQRQKGTAQEIGIINLLNPDGTLNESAAPFAGMKRDEARTKCVEEMERLGHFVSVEERKIPIKHSDRSKTPIEPYLSDQWFVRMGDENNGKAGLAQKAIDAVDQGYVRFFPGRYSKSYTDWLGEKRDWCISRQLWWGHRIPIWSRKLRPDDTYVTKTLEKRAKLGSLQLVTFPDVIDFPERADGAQLMSPGSAGSVARLVEGQLLVCVADGHPEIEKQLEADGFQQDPDVLDTWFSSALWPHATLGWPDEDHDPPMDQAEIAKQTALASSPSTLNHQPSTSADGNAVLKTFYPGNVLITSRDIITLWVARMVLTGLYNLGEVPFQHVCVHPKILDGFGQTMSKTKGNGVDPMDLIDKYGADAVRFTIASFAGETQDVKLTVGYECPHCQNVIPQEQRHQKLIPAGGAKPRIKCAKCKKESQFTSAWFEPDPGEPVARIVSERFEYGRNFCNKLWNASRFAMLNLEGYTPGPVADADLKLEDRWILSRLATVSREVTTLLDRYQLDAATRELRDFTWNEFCDWYLEMVKPRLRDEALRPVAQRVLVTVLDALLRLLQPFTPFICEELWHRLNEVAPVRAEKDLANPQAASEACIVAPWPELPIAWQDRTLESRFNRLQETIVAVRNVRAVYSISPAQPLKLYMRCGSEVAADMQSVSGQFDNLARVLLEAAGATVERPNASASFSLTDADGYIPLEGIVDLQAELQRQKKEREKLKGFIAGHAKKLENESFVAKAPAAVVEQIRETLAGLQKQLDSVEEIIRQLGG